MIKIIQMLLFLIIILNLIIISTTNKDQPQDYGHVGPIPALKEPVTEPVPHNADI